MEQFFRGVVVSGLGEAGAVYGVPTANLSLEMKTSLAPGVYLAQVEHNDVRHGGVVCIGADGKDKFEVHLLDFTGDIVGHVISGEILAPVSSLIPWESVAQMRAKIAKDVVSARGMWTQLQSRC